MDNETNDLSGEDKLDKIIEKKSNETEALKELLKKLNDEASQNENANDKKQTK